MSFIVEFVQLFCIFENFYIKMLVGREGEEKYLCYGSDMVFLYTPPSLEIKGLNSGLLNRKGLNHTFLPVSHPTNG